jgi:hypothetical protein
MGLEEERIQEHIREQLAHMKVGELVEEDSTAQAGMCSSYRPLECLGEENFLDEACARERVELRFQHPEY